MIRVRLYSSLNHYIPKSNQEKWFEVSLADAPNIISLIEMLKIPNESVAIVAVNNKAVRPEDYQDVKLADHEEVRIFPIISGG